MNNQLRINVNKQDAYRFFPILLGVYLLINAVLSLFFIEGITEGNTAMYYIVAGASTLSLGLVSFAYCKIAKVDFLAGAKLKTFPKWYTLVFAVLCGLSLIAVMLPVNNWFLEFLVKCGLPEPSVDIPLTNDFWGIVCAVIFVCILPAFCEEVAFRGIVGSGLTNSAVKGKLVLMLLFSGFLFMIFHMNPAQTLHQFILGVLLSYFLVATGSSWTPIIIHFVNNLVAIILELTVGDAFIENGKWWLLGIGLVAFAVFFTLFMLTNKTERKDMLTESAEPVIVDKIVLTVGVMCCIGMWIATLFAK